MRGSQMWPEPRASKVSRDLAPKPAAAPFERRSASDQSAVERWLGTRADTSTRHRSRRRLAPALDMRLASCSFSFGCAGEATRLGRPLWLPVSLGPIGPGPRFPVAIWPVAILPVPFSPARQARDRRKVLVGAWV